MPRGTSVYKRISDIPFRTDFYDTSIFRIGTVAGAPGCMVFFKRTAPHKIASAPVLPIGKHRETGVTQRRSVFIDPDRVWIVLGLQYLLLRSIKALIPRSLRRR